VGLGGGGMSAGLKGRWCSNQTTHISTSSLGSNTEHTGKREVRRPWQGEPPSPAARARAAALARARRGPPSAHAPRACCQSPAPRTAGRTPAAVGVFFGGGGAGRGGGRCRRGSGAAGGNSRARPAPCRHAPHRGAPTATAAPPRAHTLSSVASDASVSCLSLSRCGSLSAGSRPSCPARHGASRRERRLVPGDVAAPFAAARGGRGPGASLLAPSQTVPRTGAAPALAPLYSGHVP
jgi:hypothetical protein